MHRRTLKMPHQIKDTFHIWSIVFSQKLKRLKIQENYSSKHIEREGGGDDSRWPYPPSTSISHSLLKENPSNKVKCERSHGIKRDWQPTHATTSQLHMLPVSSTTTVLCQPFLSLIYFIAHSNCN